MSDGDKQDQEDPPDKEAKPDSSAHFTPPTFSPPPEIAKPVTRKTSEPSRRARKQVTMQLPLIVLGIGLLAVLVAGIVLSMKGKDPRTAGSADPAPVAPAVPEDAPILPTALPTVRGRIPGPRFPSRPGTSRRRERASPPREPRHRCQIRSRPRTGRTHRGPAPRRCGEVDQHQKTLQEKIAESERLSRLLSEALTKLAAVEKPEDFIPIIRMPQVVTPRLRDYYGPRGNTFPGFASAQSDEFYRFESNGRRYLLAKGLWSDFSETVVAFSDEGSALKLDWEGPGAVRSPPLGGVHEPDAQRSLPLPCLCPPRRLFHRALH